MNPATLWYFYDPHGGWGFNHLSDGHEWGERPAPKCPNQVGPWSKGTWDRYHVWLTTDKPAKVVYGSEDLP